MAGQPQLLVLGAPMKGIDVVYDRLYDSILKFQANFAKAIIEAGDRVLILVDKHAERCLRDQHGIDSSYLLRWPMEDIWLRDFTLVEPTRHPSQFIYTPQAQGGKASDARYVQAGFNKLAKAAGLKFEQVPLLLDGGNWVSDGAGRVIVTERFLVDNKLRHDTGLQAFQKYFPYHQLAILPDDDPDGLGHADGMAMFLDSQIVCVNTWEEPMRSDVARVLQHAFPGIQVVELPTVFDEHPIDPKYSSSSGIYVNAPVTERAVYVPVYGLDTDGAAVNIIRQHTSKAVLPIPSAEVCKMGGACRCLSLQLAGTNAQALLDFAARERGK